IARSRLSASSSSPSTILAGVPARKPRLLVGRTIAVTATPGRPARWAHRLLPTKPLAPVTRTRVGTPAGLPPPGRSPFTGRCSFVISATAGRRTDWGRRSETAAWHRLRPPMRRSPLTYRKSGQGDADGLDIGETGAGEGNRTLVVSLGSFCSTIELHPRRRRDCHKHGPAVNVSHAVQANALALCPRSV